MKKLLDRIRKSVSIPLKQQIFYSCLILMMGIILGVFTKVLDETASNELPYLFQLVDLGNFFGRMGVWIFVGVCISLYSKTPWRAGLNTLLFFVGMVSSYYLYTIFVAGFFPRDYMIQWIVMTALSFPLGIGCWYAKGTHPLSMAIATLIVTMMARQSFAFGFWYFDILYGLELLLLLATIVVLYQTPKQLLMIVGSATLLFFLLSPINIFWGML